MSSLFSIHRFFPWNINTKAHHSTSQTRQGARQFESVAMDETPIVQDLTPVMLQNLLIEGGSGNLRLQTQWIRKMLEQDPVIQAHLQTRRLAVTGKSWSVSSKKFPELARLAEIMLDKAHIQSLINHLSFHVLWGYSGAVIDWESGGGNIQGFLPIRAGAFEFDALGNPAVYDTQGTPHAFEEFPPNQMLFLAHNAPNANPACNGIGRTLLHLFLLKQNSLKDWNRLIEKFGIPLVLGRLPSGAQESELRDMVNALKKMTRDGVAAVSGEESNLQLLQPNATGNVHELLCRYIDESITLLLLGQRASSAGSSGLSKGDIQGQVRQDLIAADATQIIRTIQQQVLNPWLRYAYNLNDTEHDITFWINYEAPEDFVAKADVCQKIAAATHQNIDKTWAENFFGLHLSEENPDQT